jgi:hypothetical protein
MCITIGKRAEVENDIYLLFKLICKIKFMDLFARYRANLQKAFGRDDDHKWPRYLKTHDYYYLLQHIFPVAIIGLASAEVQDAIWLLGTLLRWVCSKEIFVEKIPIVSRRRGIIIFSRGHK